MAAAQSTPGDRRRRGNHSRRLILWLGDSGGLPVVVTKARGSTASAFVCCAGCKRSPKINPGLLDFCPVNYFQKGVTVFSGTHIVKFFSLQWASFQLVIYQPSILQDHS